MKKNKTSFRFQKEVISIIGGGIIAYLLQLSFIFLVWQSNRKMIIETWKFIPMKEIMLPGTIIVAWLLMGVIGVSWERLWNIVTARITLFALPFVFIPLIVLFIRPIILYQSITFWIINVVISVLTSYSLTRYM